VTRIKNKIDFKELTEIHEFQSMRHLLDTSDK
jgi:hypothetical protein